MTRIMAHFERYIILILLVLMMLAVLASTVELAIILVQQLLRSPLLLLNIEEMLEVFGFFLMVLIGLELLETIKAYLDQDKVHAEVVFFVAMVAVARKIIIMDYREISPGTLYGMSVVILALSIGYYLVKRSLAEYATKKKSPADR